MPISQEITSQMKDAMRAKDKVRLGALRGVRAAFIEAMKKDGSDDLADDAAIAILRRLAKQRQESVDAFTAGDRPELAAQEKAELGVIEAFLPSLADEATTEAWVRAAIEKTGASSPGEMGKVMGMVMAAHKGQADGKLTKNIALRLLQG